MDKNLRVFIEYLNEGLPGVAAGLESVDNHLVGLGRRADQLNEKLQRVDQTLAGWQRTASLLAGAGVGGLGLLMQHGLSINSVFEDIHTNLETVTKSSEKAEAAMKTVVELTANTPLQLQGVAEAAVAYLAAGDAIDHMSDRLTLFADVAAIKKQPIRELVDAVQKLRTTGYWETEQMARFGLYKGDMAAILGMDKGGRLGGDADQKYQALLQIMEDSYGGGAQSMMANLSGLISNWRDKITLTLKEIGDAVDEQAKDWVGRLNSRFDELLASDKLKGALHKAFGLAMDEVEPYFEKALDWLDKLIDYLERNPEALVNGMRTFVDVLKTLVAVVATLTAARGIIALITSLTSIVGLLGGGIPAAIGIAAGGIGLIALFNLFKGAMEGTSLILPSLATNLGSAASQVQELKREMQGYRQEQDEAKAGMEKAGKTASGLKAELGELEEGSSEAAKAQAALNEAQTALAEYESTYVTAINNEITALNQYKDALDRTADAESVLAELQAQRARGWNKDGTPVTTAQKDIEADHVLAEQIGRAYYTNRNEQFGDAHGLWKQYGIELPSWGSAEYFFGNYDSQYRQLGYKILRDHTRAKQSHHQYKWEADQLIREKEIRAKYPWASDEMILSMVNTVGPTQPPPVQSGVPPISGSGTPGSGYQVGDFMRLVWSGDSADPNQPVSDLQDLRYSTEQTVALKQQQTELTKRLIEATEIKVKALEREAQLSGEDKSEEITKAKARLYLDLYTQNLAHLVDSGVLSGLADAYKANRDALNAVTDKLKRQELVEDDLAGIDAESADRIRRLRAGGAGDGQIQAARIFALDEKRKRLLEAVANEDDPELRAAYETQAGLIADQLLSIRDGLTALGDRATPAANKLAAVAQAAATAAINLSGLGAALRTAATNTSAGIQGGAEYLKGLGRTAPADSTAGAADPFWGGTPATAHPPGKLMVNPDTGELGYLTENCGPDG